jgi:hypothetical protein
MFDTAQMVTWAAWVRAVSGGPCRGAPRRLRAIAGSSACWRHGSRRPVHVPVAELPVRPGRLAMRLAAIPPGSAAQPVVQSFADLAQPTLWPVDRPGHVGVDRPPRVQVHLELASNAGRYADPPTFALWAAPKVGLSRPRPMDFAR